MNIRSIWRALCICNFHIRQELQLNQTWLIKKVIQMIKIDFRYVLRELPVFATIEKKKLVKLTWFCSFCLWFLQFDEFFKRNAAYTWKLCRISRTFFVVSISMVWIIDLKLTIGSSCDVQDDVHELHQSQNCWNDDLRMDCLYGGDGDVGSHWIFLK